MELDTLKALYVEGLRDLYSAETQILKALPKMKSGATSPELKQAFEEHFAVTTEQVGRLEEICSELGISPKGKHCKGMEGLITEGADLMKEDADPDVMDAGLISAAQHVEHYEMAGYGTVRTYAQLLGYDEQAALLQTSLLEERETDVGLTELALTVNVDAIAKESPTTGGAKSA
jgi:ferritin-like metal-binding protein YciE